ncbi:MAG: penicillin-binding transpeptidase domain-containing protein [Actinomycetota bacterium]|nr:penicillin-binding transpeptidase domain-containing protein [Actinomycetota bacterium]
MSLNPFRGRGRHINEPRPVGIRDLVASPEEVQARPERRWRIIGGFFSLLLVLLLVRLFMLQILEQSASVATVRSNSLHVATIPASRGLIVSRSGTPLVSNVTTTEILLSRQQAYLNPSVIGALATLTRQSVSQVQSDLTNVQYDPYQPAPVMTNAPTSVVQFIKLHPGEFPGVSVQGVTQRSYPLGGNTASQLLGYVGPITGAEMAANPTFNYTTNSTYGKTGIENFYEQYLRGIDGTSTIEVSAQGNILGAVQKTPPQQGDSVILNVDAGLQKALDGYLAADIALVRHTPDPTNGVLPPALNGAALVMDVNSGAVLAMSSYPSFDLSSFVNGLSQATFKTLLNEGAFTNYPIQGLYTPGSTFKLITATAQMQTGVFPATQLVNDTGYYTVPGCLQGAHGCVFHDDQGQGAGLVDLPMAITVSSDYYFYQLGYLFWSQQAKYGETPIQNVAHQYGLDQYSNIDLPNEVQGRVDSPTVRIALHNAAPLAFPNDTWYTGDNIEMAFGQGSTAITPVALADAYATFANGGTRYAPEVAAAVVSPSGKLVVRYGPRVLGHVSLPPAVRDPILQGLEGVVQNPSGTAYGTFQHYATFSQSVFPVAGKTGTASTGYYPNGKPLEPNSLFVGFAPANHPQYVVVCAIAQGGYGADAAAPVVAQTFDYLYRHPLGPLVLTVKSQVAPVTTTTHPPTTTTGSAGANNVTTTSSPGVKTTTTTTKRAG